MSNKFLKASIEVNGRGTTNVMEWIRDNNCPTLDCTTFTHNGKSFLTVSNADPRLIDSLEDMVELGLRSWHEYSGMYRMTNYISENWPAWVFHINDQYYFATM